MKIQPSSKHYQRGMAVVVMLALMSLMLIGVAAGVRSLTRLDRELKLLDQRQTRRLAATSVTHSPTNSLPTTTTPAGP